MPEHTPTDDLRCLVLVDPSERGQGVGAALWDAMQPIFQAKRPNHLRANGNGTDPDSIAWAERRGFVRAHHLLSQQLDLADFEPASWLGGIRKAESQGFRFVPFCGLRSPETERELHALYHALLADTPDFTEGDYKAFEPWRAWAFESDGAWPDGWIMLVAPTGEWAGFTLMQRTPAGAHIFMTGVAPAHRGKGLAIPLKVAAALHARENGVAALTTLNHAANERIVAVNRTLGYRVTEDVIRLVKRCAWE
ncbi:MAG: hypothetical protein JWN15_972 [Firmicutes bacterium]|nr:hypothetical protein [Bacillota bacterium]